MNTELNRRQFLGAAAATIAAARLGRGQEAAMPEGLCSATGYTPTKVLRIYMGSRPAWPTPDLDMDAEAKRMQAEFDKVKGLDDIDFVGNVRVRDVNELKKLLDQHKDIDGVLGAQVAMGTSPILNTLAEMGIPTIQFAIPYSGHEWHIVPDLMARGKKIDSIPTSNFADLAVAVRPFRAIHRLKETKILYVSGGSAAPEKLVAEVKAKFGTEIRTYDHKALVAAYESIKPEAAEAECEGWVRNAQAVKEPPREEILKSARMCLALQKVLADEKAQAITINCLGLFGQKALPAYPCFGFARLNDLGLTGVCEADLSSTLTQVIYLHLTGKPGFVTDPMFDTSNDTVIHAHCVAATKMDGPTGESAPYVIRTHLEDLKGAVLQVKMRVGQEITMAKLVGGPRKDIPTQVAASPAECLATGTMLLSTGTIAAVPDVDRGCRTKITVKVKDARKMFEQWSYGLHRVIFYGNHVADTRRLARFAGFDVVEEG